MTYTSMTAVIITLHHLSTVTALILAAIITAPIYWLFLRKRSHRALTLGVTFVLAFLISSYASESVFLRTPVNIEIVSAG